MKRNNALIAFCFALFCASPALAQSGQPTIQSGIITPGHAVMWIADGTVADAGTAAEGYLTSLGVTASGPSICANSGPVTGPFNELCLGVTQTGGGVISLIGYNGATGSLSFNLNGTILSFPSPLIIGQRAIVGGTVGNCLTVGLGNVLGQATCGGGGGGGITIGSTTITGGTSGKILYDNSGAVGELSVSGSGNVVLTTSATLVAPALGTPISGVATNLTGLPLTTGVTGVLPVANGGDNCSVASLTCFNNITGFTTASTTGTTSTNLVFSGTPTIANLVLTGTPTGAGSIISINSTNCALAGSCIIPAGALSAGSTVVNGGPGVLSNASSGGTLVSSTTLPSGLTAASFTVTTAFTATGLVSNSDLTYDSMDINGQTCTLGSSLCTVPAAAGSLTGTTLNSTVVTSSLTTVGTIGTGVWQGTSVALGYGGTNNALTASNGGVVYSDGSKLNILAGTATALQCLVSGSNSAPQWYSCSGSTSAVSSVTDSGAGTLTISPNTGAVLAAINLGNANTWTAAQTFTNGDFKLKGSSSGAMTLEAPAVASTYVMTFPAATDTVDVLGTAQTFTAAKSFESGNLQILNSNYPTDTGYTALVSANAGNSNYTLTLPAVTSTVAVLGVANQTFTATETFSGAVIVSGTFQSPNVYGGSSAGSTLALISTSSGSPSGDTVTISAGGSVVATIASTGVSIGETSSYPFAVKNTNTATSGIVELADYNFILNPASSSTTTGEGINVTVNVIAGENTSGLYGGLFYTKNSGTGTMSSAASVYTSVTNSGGGTLSAAYGVLVSTPVGASAGTSTWTYINGIAIADQNPSGVGTNTLTNPPVALYISSQSATGAYAIQTAGGIVSFGGKVYMTGLTSGSGSAALCLNSSGDQVESDTSSTICGISALRFKDLRQPVSPEQGLAGIAGLQSASWRYKEPYQDHGKNEHVGLIADEVEAMDPRCAVYDHDGSLLNYSDRCIEAYLVGAIQELRQEIRTLRSYGAIK